MDYRNDTPISEDLKKYLSEPIIKPKKQSTWSAWWCPLKKDCSGWKFNFTFRFW